MITFDEYFGDYSDFVNAIYYDPDLRKGGYEEVKYAIEKWMDNDRPDFADNLHIKTPVLCPYKDDNRKLSFKCYYCESIADDMDEILKGMLEYEFVESIENNMKVEEYCPRCVYGDFCVHTNIIF